MDALLKQLHAGRLSLGLGHACNADMDVPSKNNTPRLPPGRPRG